MVTSLRLTPLAIWLTLGLAFTAVDAARAQAVWSGPSLTFTKAPFADSTAAVNQDRITDLVWLTRGPSKGLINIEQEPSYTHGVSPIDTAAWAFGNAADWATLSFGSWEDWFASNPTGILGQNAVVHLFTDDIYIDIKFLSWGIQPTSGAGFSYIRAVAPGPATRTWAGTGDNTWDFAALNWSAPAPGVAYTDGLATILNDSGTNTAINLTTNVSPLSLMVSNNLVAYSITGAGSINGAGSLTKNGSNALTLGTSNGFTGGSTFNGGITTVNHTNGLGTGAVVTANTGTELHFTSTVNIGALTVGTNTLVAADASGQNVIVTAGLSIAGGSTNTPAGTVQLHDNSMIVHSGSGGGDVLAVRAAIKAARNGGAWDQPGITTDLSTNIPGKVTTLAYAQGSDTNLAIASIHGQAIGTNDVVVKYTYVGDANMDGSVDGLDIAKWAVNFTGALGLGPTDDPAKTWTQGDWNFDGSVDGLDAAIWATNFTGAFGGGGLAGTVVDAPGASPAAIATLEGMGLTVVPEPASLVLLGLGGALIFGGGRRSRNARCAAERPPESLAP